MISKACFLLLRYNKFKRKKVEKAILLFLIMRTLCTSNMHCHKKWQSLIEGGGGDNIIVAHP